MKRLESIIAACCITAAAAFVIAGSASAAFPGTNGKIAVAHDPGTPDSGRNIFSIDPNGQSLTQLTSGPAFDGEPAWSANGERIAFTRDPDGMSNAQIWVMNFDGTGQTQITSNPAVDDTDPFFFPDGKRLAIQRDAGDDQIFVINADGTNPVQLTFPGPNADESFSPSVSPDGQKIVFRFLDGATGLSEIWEMNPDGSGKTRLATGSAAQFDLDPDWSPNGQRIVVDRLDFSGGGGENLFVMNADGSGQTPITSSAESDLSPVFAPDGGLVALARLDSSPTSNIFVVNPDGLNLGVTPLTANAAPVRDFTPSWQPLNPPACELSGKKKQKSLRKVALTLTCDENATALAEGTGKAKFPKLVAVASKKKKKFTLEPASAEVAEATPTTLTLRIPKKGRKALKKASKAGKKGKATIIATATDDLGQSAASNSFKVKIKKK